MESIKDEILALCDIPMEGDKYSAPFAKHHIFRRIRCLTNDDHFVFCCDWSLDGEEYLIFKDLCTYIAPTEPEYMLHPAKGENKGWQVTKSGTYLICPHCDKEIMSQELAAIIHETALLNLDAKVEEIFRSFGFYVRTIRYADEKR